jgi:hypothetical protein
MEVGKRSNGPLADAVRQLGWLNGILFLTSRVLEKLSGGSCKIVKYWVVAQPVALSPDRRQDRPVVARLRVELSSPSHPLVHHSPRPMEVIGRRFRDGAVCFVATFEGSFAGFLWIQQGPYEEDEVRCLFAPEPAQRVAWDFDVYVEPRFRLGRAFSELWSAAQRYLAERGYTWTMSRISAFNPQSLRVHERLGARKVASALFLLAGRLQISMLTKRPFVHVSMRARSRPTLRVAAPR